MWSVFPDVLLIIDGVNRKKIQIFFQQMLDI